MANSRSEIYNKNIFFRDYFQQIIFFLMLAILALIIIVSWIMFQVMHRPIPTFSAITPEGKVMPLTAYLEPNLRSNVVLKWASKAATLSYNFGFSDYEEKIQAVRPYFTSLGWQSYQAGVKAVTDRITQNKIIVQGVVSGAPVISNQGPLPGQGYTWRVQIPFLVTYLSSDKSRSDGYFVIMNIVKVPTHIAPQGIGIDTFEMR